MRQSGCSFLDGTLEFDVSFPIQGTTAYNFTVVSAPSGTCGVLERQSGTLLSCPASHHKPTTHREERDQSGMARPSVRSRSTTSRRTSARPLRTARVLALRSLFSSSPRLAVEVAMTRASLQVSPPVRYPHPAPMVGSGVKNNVGRTRPGGRSDLRRVAGDRRWSRVCIPQEAA